MLPIKKDINKEIKLNKTNGANNWNADFNTLNFSGLKNTPLAMHN